MFEINRRLRLTERLALPNCHVVYREFRILFNWIGTLLREAYSVVCRIQGESCNQYRQGKVTMSVRTGRVCEADRFSAERSVTLREDDDDVAACEFQCTLSLAAFMPVLLV